MSDLHMVSDTGSADARAPLIEIHLTSPSPKRDARGTTVCLSGEHDVGTCTELQETLTALHGDVVVDLGDCAFIDSSTICVLVNDARRRARDGYRLTLVVPAGNLAVARTLEITGVREVLEVRSTAATW